MAKKTLKSSILVNFRSISAIFVKNSWFLMKKLPKKLFFK